jgi:hypothetical protein
MRLYSGRQWLAILIAILAMFAASHALFSAESTQEKIGRFGREIPRIHERNE